MFLYAITNLVNGKRYMGITVDFEYRWYQHRLGYGSKLVYQAIKKYGIENLDFKIICKGTEAYIREMEIRAIRMLNTMAPSGYNLSEGGEGCGTGRKITDETRKKMSEAQQGKIASDETRKKMSASQKGRIHSKETREKMRKARQGQIHSKETRRKLREAQEGRVYSEKTRKKMSESHKGKTHSLETRKKMSEAQQGKIVSDETCKKMSQSRKGKYKRGEHSRAIKVVIDAKQYNCLRDAAEDIGMPYSTFCDKQRSTKAIEFSFQPKGVLTPLTS